MKTCRTCGEELSAARLAAKPDAVQCVRCVQENGDEPPVRGHMVWDHKTAPSIEIGTKLAANAPQAHPQQGKNAAGLSQRDLDTDADYDGIVFNTRTARCHPTRPAVGPSGLCANCALEWYSRRRRD